MVRFNIAIEANPYPTRKVIGPTWTECEIYERIVKIKNWNSHKAGKKHHEAKRTFKE
jgi:hypothetical protein